ncbi:Hypothetical Protein FCC1311_082502 [Hondaea fermentalgiana]|uniref:DSBA-like thioredoxin domain-containing protein n=1 Tax=Hondaea fermentalgiana TaxID=2315210 RepID=A0A2R5GN33_9STRA|nr:Hypothetical Protein FCC1311_082502 [Hondaea fermentalgiana]|eukprot:GBG32025.1 Hypothetical Protein FCC1311_082502 [Hondaea fermentalgiana]
MTSTRGTLAIDIYADPTCPWCWIGKRNLDEAIRQSGRAANITWCVYLLRPEVPEEGSDRQEDVRPINDQLLEAAKTAGIELTDKCDRVPSTLKAHALMRYAEMFDRAGSGHELVEVLFRRYLHDGEFIGSEDVLRAAAEEVGIADMDRAFAYIRRPDILQEIREDSRVNARRGISSVPTFFVNGRPIFSGAQPVYKFLEILNDEAKLVDVFRVD